MNIPTPRHGRTSLGRRHAAIGRGGDERGARLAGHAHDRLARIDPTGIVAAVGAGEAAAAIDRQVLDRKLGVGRRVAGVADGRLCALELLGLFRRKGRTQQQATQFHTLGLL